MVIRPISGPIRRQFNKSSSYKTTSAAASPFMLDTWYENPNYGFFNDSYEPVVPNIGDKFENLVTFGDYAKQGQRTLPFVQKAFNQFRTKFFERVEFSNVAEPKFLEGMNPKKSYESFDEKYQEYMNNVTKQYSVIEGINKEQFLERVLKNISTFPITMSGFGLSRHCPISVTGLSIELATLPYNDLSIKRQILNSDSFGCYAEDVTSEGFFIDSNNPWRIIANLDSPEMKKHIQAYKEETTTENILNRFFRKKTQYEDLASVFNFFTNQKFSLTTSELLSYTIKIRMQEVGMDTSHYHKINEEAQTILEIYAGNYPNDPLKGPAGLIGKYCSEKLKETYEKRAKTIPETLKEYM